MSGERLLPTENPVIWQCAPSGVFDIKRWFVGVITPDFSTEEVQSRLRCSSQVPDKSITTPAERRRKSIKAMAAYNEEVNQPQTGKRRVHSSILSPMDAGGVRTCSSALAATALGAGALALPHAFSLVGIGLGLVTLIFAGLISALSLQILMVGARYTGTKSYAAVLELSVGSKWASTLLDLIVLCNGVGAIICILIFEGDFVPAAIASPPFMEGYTIPRSYAVIGATILVWPLCLSSNISALRYVAVAVPSVMLLTMIVVLADTPHFLEEVKKHGDEIKFWDFELKKWLQAVAIMVNAFANHMNAIPCVNQLDQPSIARIVKATVNGNMIVFILLATLGVGGYASFGSATLGDFLLNYPAGRTEIWCCRVMLAIIVYLVLPVSLLPTAKSGAQLFLSCMGQDKEISATTHAGCSTVLLCVCCFVAVKVSDVSSVIGFLGGFFASSLMFWFPAAVFRMLLWPTMPRVFRCPVLFMLVLLGSLGWASVLANNL